MTTPTPQPARQGPAQVIRAIEWAPGCASQHVQAIETANRLFGCVQQSLNRVYPSSGCTLFFSRPGRASGGRRRHGRLQADPGVRGTRLPLVCKIPHQRRLVYAENAGPHTHDDATSELLDTLACLADTINRRAAAPVSSLRRCLALARRHRRATPSAHRGIRSRRFG